MRSLMQITAVTPSKHRAFYLDPASDGNSKPLWANGARTETALSFSFDAELLFCMISRSIYNETIVFRRK